MRKKFDKEKLLIIGILPLMWFAYFLFELFTGRIKSLYDICLNLSLLFLFAFVGFIIYCIQRIWNPWTALLIRYGIPTTIRYGAIWAWKNKIREPLAGIPLH